jgi:predicted O-methyltransferase YrrM
MLDYFEVCMRLVRAGGIILADNTLWSGAVIEPAISDQQTEAIRNFNDAVSKDPRVEATLVNVADGIMVLRKNGST